MKLSDAALIGSALQEVAKSAEDMAKYLESERYAENQRDEFVRREQEKSEGPRQRRSSWPGLSDSDMTRIGECRSRAERLRKLWQGRHHSTLAAYCVAWSRWVESEKWIAEHGTVMTIKDDKGNIKSYGDAPQLKIAERSSKEVVRLGRLLGI
jgi:phage terminase small subunit